MRSINKWATENLLNVTWIGASNALQGQSFSISDELISLAPVVNPLLKYVQQLKPASEDLAVQRTLSGVKWGLVMGALLSVWVLILIPFNGSSIFRSKSGAEYHAGWIILTYLVRGISTGALFGAMAFLLRHKVGAFSLGALAMLPLGFGLLITENHFTLWTRTETMPLVILALFLGGPGGLIVRAFALGTGKGHKPERLK